MTSAEIAELRDFISGGLGKVHTRLDGLGGRLGRVEDALSELRDDQHRFQDHVARHFTDFSTRLRQVEIVGEAMRHDFRSFGESLTDVDRKVDELRSDMNMGFQALRDEIRLGFQSHGGRVDAVEARVDHLEAER